MSPLIKNKIIAAFFLMLFSVSTITGFACSVGIDMGYNSKHHSEEHHVAHAHLDEAQSQHIDGRLGPLLFDGSDKDDCCRQSVAKFIQIDKLVTDNQWVSDIPIFLLAFTSSYLTLTPCLRETVADFKFSHLRRSCGSNDTDIRIAIQSFQI